MFKSVPFASEIIRELETAEAEQAWLQTNKFEHSCDLLKNRIDGNNALLEKELGITSVLLRWGFRDKPDIVRAAGSVPGKFHRRFREGIFPNANISTLAFFRFSPIHHTGFFVYDEAHRRVAEKLREAGPQFMDTVILETSLACPRVFEKWVRDHRGVTFGTEAEVKSALLTFGDLLKSYANELHPVLLRAAFEAARASSVYTEARRLPAVNSTAYRALKDWFGRDLVKPDECALWAWNEEKGDKKIIHSYDDPLDGGDFTPRPREEFLRHSLWWLIYLLKCSLNPNAYVVYRSNPSIHAGARSGIVLIADMPTDPEMAMERATGIQFFALGLLNIVDRMVLAEADRSRREAETDARRADLAATFSHAYVKQAAAIEARGQRIADAAKSSVPDDDIEMFRLQLQAYRTEMDVFAHLSQSRVWFEADQEANREACMPLAAFVLRGLVFALLIAPDADFKDVAKEILPEEGRLKNAYQKLRNLPTAAAVDDAWGLLAGNPKIKFIFSGNPGCLPSQVKLRPPKRLNKFDDEKLLGIFGLTLEKIFFEIGCNAVRHWCQSYRDLGMKLPLSGATKPEIRISYRAGSPIVSISNTAFFNPPGSDREQAYKSFFDKMNSEAEPPRPGKTGGLGGWGMYGNTLIARLFRDDTMHGRFRILREIDPPVTLATREPFAHRYVSTLMLPTVFFLK